MSEQAQREMALEEWVDRLPPNHKARVELAALKRQIKSADYWNNWVYPEGATPENIQNELADFKDMIDRFECVLEHITGGQMSKATYAKEVMISVIDDKINELVDEETAALKRENERYTDVLERIVDWSRAYPIDVFPEPDLKKAHAVLKANGMTLDAISASSMRHVVAGVGKMAKDALLKEPE